MQQFRGSGYALLLYQETAFPAGLSYSKRNLNMRLACLPVLACSVAVSVTAASLKVPKIAYQEYRLPNGLQVILHEDHRLPLVALDLWYHVGPRNEVQGRTGFAHLFEHMMFEGSEHVGEKAHFRYLEGAGATDVNGTTDFDRTNYFETLPSNQLELGLWLESDRMGFLLEKLDQTRLTNQRDVVRNERRQGEGTPYVLADEETFHLLFPRTHPYYASVIGSHADIEAARLLDVRDFHQRFYTPRNSTLVIAGDFDPATLKPLLVKYFGPIPGGPPVPAVTVVTPRITAERRSVVTDTVQLPRVTFAWLAAPAFKPGDAEAELIARMLGGGNSSRLYQRLVYQKQLAQNVECSEQSLALASVAVCNVTARPGVQPGTIEQEMNAEVEDLRAHGPSQDELERARNVVLANRITPLQRLGGFGGIADTLNFYNQYAGDPGYLPKDIARFNAATVQSVRQVAESTFGRQQRVTVYAVTGPKVLHDVPRSPDNTDVNVKVVDAYTPAFEAEQNWRNQAPSAGPAPKPNLPVPASFALPNGMRVYVVENHGIPVIQATVVDLAGADANPADRPGLAAYTARMLRQGTAKRSATDIANFTDQIGGRLRTNATEDAAYLSMEALSNQSASALDLLSDMARNPAFDASEVDRVRKERLAAIIEEGDNPIRTVLRVGQKVVYGNGPYAYPPTGTNASVQATTAQDVRDFWKDHFAPQNAALVLAGDVTESEAHDLASRYFGNWSSPGARQALPPPVAPDAPKREIVIVDKPGAPQTALFAFGIGLPRNTPDYASNELMNEILGGLFSSRLNMNLRERNGYTYGAFSFFEYHRGAGPFLTGALVRTDVTGPAAQELAKELTSLNTDPPTPTELTLAKNFALQSLPGQFETAQETAEHISDLFVFNLPLDYYKQLPSQFDAATSSEVAEAARRNVRPNEMVLVAVGDRAKIEPGLKKLDFGDIEYRDALGEKVATPR